MAFFNNNNSYRLITFTANDQRISLRTPFSSIPDTVVIEDVMDINTAGFTGCSIRMPSAKTLQEGNITKFVSLGTTDVIIESFDPAPDEIIAMLPTGVAEEVQVLDISTPQGAWTAITNNNSTTNISLIGITSKDGTLTVTGSPVTGVMGTIDLSVNSTLPPPISFSGTGYVTHIGGNEYLARTFQNSSEILVDNPSGVNGNTSFRLNNDIGNRTIGNFQISDNSITQASDNLESMRIDSAGDSNLVLNNVVITTAGDISTPGTVTTDLYAWAYCTIADGVVTIESSSANISNAYIMDDDFILVWSVALPSSAYGVLATPNVGLFSGVLSRTTTSVQINTVNPDGVLTQPTHITIAILSLGGA